MAIIFVTFTESCKKEEAVIPTVSTLEATDVQYQTATLKGDVTDDGGATVSERGFIYSNQSNLDPTVIGVISVKAGSGTGAFTSAVTGLSPNTTYYVKSYAINEAGTAYGTVLTFQTL